MGTGNYSATSDYVNIFIKKFGTARRGLGGATAHPGPSSLYQL